MDYLSKYPDEANEQIETNKTKKYDEIINSVI